MYFYHMNMKAILLKKLQLFYLHCKQMHVSHILLGLKEGNKDFQALHEQANKIICHYLWENQSYHLFENIKESWF